MVTEFSKKAIIFDFDGTIADSFTVTLHIIHNLLCRPFVKDDISKLRGLSSKQVLGELNVPLWRVFFLAAKTRRLLGDHLEEITMFPGVIESLGILASQHELYILSANSKENVQEFLAHHAAQQYFVGVYGGVAPWAKARALRKLAHDRSLASIDTWYVGDGDLDIKAAHRAGMKAAAVTWGFNNIHVLKDCNPDALVFNPEELVRCFYTKAREGESPK